jgi:hypothetical protein
MTSLLLAMLAAAPGGPGFLDRCPDPLVATAKFLEGRGISAPAAGVVTVATDDLLEVRLCAYENHLVREVRLALVGPKSRAVRLGEVIIAGQRLARAVGTVTLDGVPPARFFREHPFLYDPHHEAVLVVVDVEAHQARRYERGSRTHTWEVGRGQAEGRKRVRGDLKTPRGLYFVTSKSTGPFSGDFAGYYGGHWVKLNYPNAFDAQRGEAEGVVSADQAMTITQAWWRRGLPTQQTKLGGGIGFHGWVAPWRGDVEGFGLSWGCVVLHPEEVADFYALVPVGAAVVLLDGEPAKE